MYDYLGPEQVKIFYHPIFEEKDLLTGKPVTWHSGGLLNCYDEDSELPLETMYYKYPQNFIVFDFYFDCEDVWVIKNGKFKEFKSYKELKEEDLGEAVYDYRGQELNIKSLRNFDELKKEYILNDNKYNKLEKELFPKGIIEAYKNNPEEYKNKKHIHDENYNNTLGKFYEKWFVKDKYKLEKQFGEYLDCYLFCKSTKDREISKFDNPMQRYLNCKKAVQDFIKENEGVVEKYIKWLNNDRIITAEEVYGIVEDIMGDD